MYQCEKCKHTFERGTKEITEEGTYDICPICGHDEIEEVSICVECGDMATLHEKYCESCKDHIRDTIIRSVNRLTDIAGYDRSEVFRIITDLVEREG